NSFFTNGLKWIKENVRLTAIFEGTRNRVNGCARLVQSKPPRARQPRPSAPACVARNQLQHAPEKQTGPEQRPIRGGDRLYVPASAQPRRRLVRMRRSQRSTCPAAHLPTTLGRSHCAPH